MATQKKTDEEMLYDEVRAHVATFRGANGGLDPSRGQVAEALRKRKSDVCRAMRRLEQTEAADAARLYKTPEIPAEVAEAARALLEKAWTSAHETASVAVGALRDRIADMDHRYGRQMSDAEGLLGEMESEFEAVEARASAAETDLANARERIGTLTAELDRATSALAEREALMDAIRAAATGLGTAGAGKGSGRTRKRRAEGDASDEGAPSGDRGPENGTLPMEGM